MRTALTTSGFAMGRSPGPIRAGTQAPSLARCVCAYTVVANIWMVDRTRWKPVCADHSCSAMSISDG